MESVSAERVALIRMQGSSPEIALFMVVFSGERDAGCDILKRSEVLSIILNQAFDVANGLIQEKKLCIISRSCYWCSGSFPVCDCFIHCWHGKWLIILKPATAPNSTARNPLCNVPTLCATSEHDCSKTREASIESVALID